MTKRKGLPVPTVKRAVELLVEANGRVLRRTREELMKRDAFVAGIAAALQDHGGVNVPPIDDYAALVAAVREALGIPPLPVFGGAAVIIAEAPDITARGKP